MGKKDDKKQKSESEETLEIKQRVEELENQVKRVLADYQNLEKRNREDRVQWIQTANKELILRLLPVLDTLMIASKHSTDENLKIVATQFLDVLKGEGITKIETLEKDFDPATMECITIEEGPENKVLEELRAGYMLDDIILRPAQVKVGKTSN